MVNLSSLHLIDADLSKLVAYTNDGRCTLDVAKPIVVGTRHAILSVSIPVTGGRELVDTVSVLHCMEISSEDTSCNVVDSERTISAVRWLGPRWERNISSSHFGELGEGSNTGVCAVELLELLMRVARVHHINRNIVVRTYTAADVRSGTKPGRKPIGEEDRGQIISHEAGNAIAIVHRRDITQLASSKSVLGKIGVRIKGTNHLHFLQVFSGLGIIHWSDLWYSAVIGGGVAVRTPGNRSTRQWLILEAIVDTSSGGIHADGGVHAWNRSEA